MAKAHPLNGLKTFLWVLGYPFVGFHAGIRFLVLKRKSRKYKKHPEDFLPEERYKIVNTLISAVRYLKRIKISEVIGHEQIPNKAQLIICNHRSNYDAILLYGYLYEKINCNFVFIAKKELQKSKLGFVFDFIDTIYIDRENPRSAVKVIDEQKKLLKKGKVIVVFPEGTRNHSDELLEFKSGALEPAYGALAPILPILITSTDQYCEIKKEFKGKKSPIKLKVMDEWKPTNFLSIDRMILAKNIQKKMQAEYNELVLDKTSASNKNKTKDNKKK